MKFGLKDIRIPEEVEVLEHKKGELVVFRKGSYKLVLEKKMIRRYWSHNQPLEPVFKATTETDDGTFLDNWTYIPQETLIKGINETLRKFNKSFPSETEKTNRKTLAEVYQLLGKSLNTTGNTGDLKDYFYQHCVVTYAVNEMYGYLVFKKKRAGYKGIRLIGNKGDYGLHNRVEQIPLHQALEGIKRIKENQITVMDPSEEDKNEILSMMV